MEKPILNIIILGPQGSGKGTQAALLAQKYNLAHIETGKMMRAMTKQKTALGRTLHHIVNEQGRLAPTALVIKVLKNVLDKISRKRGLIFDGFPRNLIQARALDRLFRLLGRKLTHVIYMPISRRTTIKRLALRRMCRQCGAIFILGKNLSRRAKHCPKCHGQIYQREDDKPAAIARRLAIYLQQTKPLIGHYRHMGILITIDGEPPIAAVAKKIFKLFHGDH
jgi:adenylate kinase